MQLLKFPFVCLDSLSGTTGRLIAEINQYHRNTQFFGEVFDNLARTAFIKT